MRVEYPWPCVDMIGRPGAQAKEKGRSVARSALREALVRPAARAAGRARGFQFVFSETSSMTNEVCSDESSVPVNFRVSDLPLFAATYDEMSKLFWV